MSAPGMHPPLLTLLLVFVAQFTQAALRSELTIAPWFMPSLPYMKLLVI
jgi:hypothetical protein